MIVKKEKFEKHKMYLMVLVLMSHKKGSDIWERLFGTKAFTENFVAEKVLEWTEEIEVLSTFAVSQPHASYACYTHGQSSKWIFLCRTIPNILSGNLRPLVEAIRCKFLPAITGQSALSDVERDLLALPSRLGGLGIINPVTSSDIQH